MADDDERPQVLVLGPPTSFPIIQALYSHKFHFLDPKTSSLPLHQFLTGDNCHPSSIRAILCCTRSPVSSEVLQLLPSVALVLTCSVGLNHIDFAECRRRGIQVAAVGNLYAEDVADMAVGLLIDVGANISAANRHVRSRVRSGAVHFPTRFKSSSCGCENQRGGAGRQNFGDDFASQSNDGCTPP